MIAVCVDPARVQEIWPTVAPRLRRALERGDMGTFSTLERDVLSGGALVWLAYNEPKIESAAVTQIEHTECSRVCTIAACGGDDYENWIHLIGDIETYAAEENCDAVRIIGRQGWGRVLPDYKVSRVVLEKKLNKRVPH